MLDKGAGLGYPPFLPPTLPPPPSQPAISALLSTTLLSPQFSGAGPDVLLPVRRRFVSQVGAGTTAFVCFHVSCSGLWQLSVCHTQQGQGDASSVRASLVLWTHSLGKAPHIPGTSSSGLQTSLPDPKPRSGDSTSVRWPMEGILLFPAASPTPATPH